MKDGFTQALAAAAAGQAPAPGQDPPPQEGLTGLHQQLLDSVRAREGSSPSTSTYSPGGPARGARPEGSASAPRAASPRRVRGGGAAPKGTIEAALGEIDPRATEAIAGLENVPEGTTSSALPSQSAAGAKWPYGQPPPQWCPVCAGKGFIQFGPKMVHCGRCGGEGRVPGVVLAQPYAEVETPSRVEAALAKEAEGEQPLPLEGAEDGLAVEGVDLRVGHDHGALAGGDDRAGDRGDPPASKGSAGGPLTYDLPTDLGQLPSFCYVAGPAGTGKTFQAKAWAAQNPEGVIVAATTGIAAVNLGEGTTINALLRFYNTESLRDAFTGGWLEAQVKKLRAAGLQRVVLDEVSMLDGDQLTILCRALDNVNQDRREGDTEVGLALVGDFAQLPPVKAPFAFESAEWARFAAATYRLTTIRRQADQDFVEALQAVRRGDSHAALAFFESRLEATTQAQFAGTTIVAKNEAVEKYNQLRLDKVPGAALTFPSARWGKVRSEWGGPPKPPKEWGVPEVLTLKEGALVMVLANRNIGGKAEAPEYLYVNGDLGTVVGMEQGAAQVTLQRTGETVEVVPILRENTIPLEPGRRKQLRTEGHPERVSQNGKQEVVGACHYMPLRLAYASTVHKSQGLSLDQVQINFRDSFFSQPGMLYVALSRARTAEGLRLVGTPEGFRARCTVSPKVKAWL